MSRRQMWCLSPQHLPTPLRHHLTDVAGLVAVDLPCGVLVWVPDDPDDSAAAAADPVPARVLDLQRLARRRGDDFLLFDPDVPPDLDLPHWPAATTARPDATTVGLARGGAGIGLDSAVQVDCGAATTSRDRSGDTAAAYLAYVGAFPSVGLALHDLAARARIALAYLDRGWLDDEREAPLSDVEFDALAAGFGDYDQWLARSGITTDYLDHLYRQAGIARYLPDPDVGPEPNNGPSAGVAHRPATATSDPTGHTGPGHRHHKSTAPAAPCP